MPMPVYILCCESGSEDKRTGVVSHFNVIETLQINKIVPPPDGQPPVQIVTRPGFRIVAVWRCTSPDEVGREFQYQATVSMPPDNLGKVVWEGVAQFDQPVHRFFLNLEGPMFFDGPGMLYIRFQVRAPGSPDWITQEYPIVVEELSPGTAAGKGD